MGESSWDWAPFYSSRRRVEGLEEVTSWRQVELVKAFSFRREDDRTSAPVSDSDEEGARRLGPSTAKAEAEAEARGYKGIRKKPEALK
jgi:hypothetical protein